MEEHIKKVVQLYKLGLITRNELAEMIAKEYARLWARGQILALVSK